jgi:hypothetical protein
MRSNFQANPGIKVSTQTSISAWPETVTLRVGNLSEQVALLPEHISKPDCQDCIWVNAAAARKLMLPQNCYLKYYVVHDSPLTIRLGPIVGILSTVPLEPRTNLPKGKEAALFKEMFALAKNQGILMFLFYANGINWGKKNVQGYTVANGTKTRNQWVAGTFPIPDIVYNRIRYRRIEKLSPVQKILQTLSNHPDIHLVNSRFLEKWEVYKALKSRAELSTFLPVTQPYNQKNLSAFIDKFSEVFIKPRSSSVGKGIIKVTQKPGGKFLYQYANRRRAMVSKTTTGEALFNKLKKHMDEDKDYLLQQGIDLARYKGDVFDLRTLVQKNGKGRWELTGIGVRIAAPNNFLTHVPNGGRTASFRDIMYQVFGSSNTVRRQIDSQIESIVKYLPECLEKKLNLSLAVLSIDIGVDSAGKLWIIEVNSKPASFDEDAIRLKYLRSFNDYCLFLFSQKQKREEHI